MKNNSDSRYSIAEVEVTMANAEVEPATMTLEEGAKRLGIGRDLAYRLAKAGRFPGLLRLESKYVVSNAVLERFLDGQGNWEWQN